MSCAGCPGLSPHDTRQSRAGRSPGMARARGDSAPVPSLLDGPHGAAPRRPGSERRPPAYERPAPVAHRHLRLLRRGVPDHDGDARRPDRAPAAPPDRRSCVRARLAARRILDECRDADRGPRPARDRRCDARALDARPDSQHVRGSQAADVRDRGVDHELLGRRRARPADRRRHARVLLVGLGLPARRPGDGAAARPRATRTARVQRPRSGQARSPQRRDVADGGAGGDLRAQANRPGRCRVAAGARGARGHLGRNRVRRPATTSCRPPDRPAALLGARLQRLARRLHALDSSCSSERSSSCSSTSSS